MHEGSPAEGLMRAASRPRLGGLEMQQVPCKLFPWGSRKPGGSGSSGSSRVYSTPKRKRVRDPEWAADLWSRTEVQGVQGRFGEVPVQKGVCRALAWIVLLWRSFRNTSIRTLHLMP